ncbi:short-chain dehydrogenase [Rhodothalassium salexigens]|uniref:glucose 1-dehydrogenase n=1 Tax=Rhodothalassium salexigens TaxID=1086 RepID=UPI00191421A8|nr:glucose 1-dehydrogenase [Rhodothalassium salexigens]MBK5912520.1 short-chain dehydrogenase [Rhodothalassium salexigens]MBK5919461.1 short-chain dehydrogenase [Rhodothalassium salexigens]
MTRLAGKVALVTGAVRGIGRAICERFLDNGATVFLADIDAEEGRAVAEQLGERATFLQLNVCDEDQWQAAIAQVERLAGRLDILVNNAGITGLAEHSGPQDPENTTLEEWSHVHRINLDGLFLGCKHAIRSMKKTGGGSIVNMSSRSGLVGIPAAVAYASSKAAILNHTRSVALYCAGQNYNIRCNAVAPAAIMTPIWDAMLGRDGNRDARVAQIERGIPLGHMGTPEDVAGAVLYLASDEAAYMTGTELHVDGGILAGAAAAPQGSVE